ncbi:MAG: Amuc_1102 family pilus-like protein [Chthoniobacterales bacterium]
MKTKSILVLLLLASLCFAQSARADANFQITKITKNLISSPGFTFVGAEQFAQNLRDRWLEVEVEFTSAPEFSDELTFKYYVLVGNKVLTGEVTHMNVPAGRENRSVMYVPPKVLARFNAGRAVTLASVGNIAVQIVQQGAVKSELSLERMAANWFGTLPQVSGLLLNKNETPFAPLYWDRYEQIKATTR